MMVVRANTMAMEKKADNEALGVPGYGVEGRIEKAWTWDGYDEFYSHYLQKEDRFELKIKKLTMDSVLFSYEIPPSLATSLCTEKDYKKVSKIKPQGSYDITCQLDNFPSHYVLKQNLKVFVNGQQWQKFKLDVRGGDLLLAGLEMGKSYKISMEIEGFKSISSRIRTVSPKGMIL